MRNLGAGWFLFLAAAGCSPTGSSDGGAHDAAASDLGADAAVSDLGADATTSGGGFASCPPGTSTNTTIYGRSGETSTDEVGILPTGAIMSFELTPTATSGTGGFFGSAIYGGTRNATWAVTTTACDFASPVTYLNRRGIPTPMSQTTGSNIDTTWTYGTTGQLVPGRTYYFNIRMESCDSDDCHYDSLRIW